MSSAERRKEPRHPLGVEATVVSGKHTFPGVASEISVEGLRVHSSKSISPGEKITVNLSAGDGYAIHGTVMWALASIRGGLPSYQIGIATESIADDDLLAIGYTQRAEMLQQILQQVGAGSSSAAG